MKNKSEEELFKNSLDSDELKNVAGGRCHSIGSEGNGGCSEIYFIQSCSATVEKYSRCKSDDWCYSDEVVYSTREYHGPKKST